MTVGLQLHLHIHTKHSKTASLGMNGPRVSVQVSGYLISNEPGPLGLESAQ